jgi:hypothetical protein
MASDHGGKKLTYGLVAEMLTYTSTGAVHRQVLATRPGSCYMPDHRRQASNLLLL